MLQECKENVPFSSLALVLHKCTGYNGVRIWGGPISISLVVFASSHAKELTQCDIFHELISFLGNLFHFLQLS